MSWNVMCPCNYCMHCMPCCSPNLLHMELNRDTTAECNDIQSRCCMALSIQPNSKSEQIQNCRSKTLTGFRFNYVTMRVYRYRLNLAMGCVFEVMKQKYTASDYKQLDATYAQQYVKQQHFYFDHFQQNKKWQNEQKLTLLTSSTILFYKFL